MKSAITRGVVLLAVGGFVIYWALTHSPKAGIGKIVSNELSGSYTMSEGSYYASLIVGGVLCLLGILRLYKSMK